VIRPPIVVALVLVAGCSAFDPDDGTRSVTVTTVSSWTKKEVGEATVHVCIDDGTVHADGWGTDCAVASGLGGYDGGLRIEGLEPEAYQLYVDGPEPWGDHATRISLVDDSGAVSIELDPDSIASVQVTGDFDFAEPQLAFGVGPALDCASNELVVDLPSYESNVLMADDVGGCLEIENNDFVGQVAFAETSRSPLTSACGGEWCPEWTTISRTPPSTPCWISRPLRSSSRVTGSTSCGVAGPRPGVCAHRIPRIRVRRPGTSRHYSFGVESTPARNHASKEPSLDIDHRRPRAFGRVRGGRARDPGYGLAGARRGDRRGGGRRFR
jgi:hypothetical protein